MHRRIIEFDALPDADGSRTDDDNALFLALFDEGQRLVVLDFVVGGIEIRRLRRKFGSAGIDHFEHGAAVRG